MYAHKRERTMKQEERTVPVEIDAGGPMRDLIGRLGSSNTSIASPGVSMHSNCHLSAASSSPARPPIVWEIQKKKRRDELSFAVVGGSSGRFSTVPGPATTSRDQTRPSRVGRLSTGPSPTLHQDDHTFEFLGAPHRLPAPNREFLSPPAVSSSAFTVQAYSSSERHRWPSRRLTTTFYTSSHSPRFQMLSSSVLLHTGIDAFIDSKDCSTRSRPALRLSIVFPTMLSFIPIMRDSMRTSR